jgi:ADP-ribosylglycohydrolase
MRITPLAVYAQNVCKETLKPLVEQVLHFTHWHVNVIDSGYIYCFTIGLLLINKDIPLRALQE